MNLIRFKLFPIRAHSRSFAAKGVPIPRYPDTSVPRFENHKSQIANHKSLLLLAAFAILGGCGYHTAGHANRLPESVRVIAIPGFVNKTQTYRIEQILTRDVVREFVSGTGDHRD